MGAIAYPLYISAVVIAIAYATAYVHDEFSAAWWLAYLVAINAVAFGFYIYDKVIAKLLAFLYLGFLPLRVPEDVLVWWLAFPGGTLGAVIAMYTANHKIGPNTRDFRVKLLKAYAVQATLLFVLLLTARRWVLPSREQWDALVESLVNLVLNAVQLLLETAKAS